MQEKESRQSISAGTWFSFSRLAYQCKRTFKKIKVIDLIRQRFSLNKQFQYILFFFLHINLSEDFDFSVGCSVQSITVRFRNLAIKLQLDR